MGAVQLVHALDQMILEDRVKIVLAAAQTSIWSVLLLVQLEWAGARDGTRNQATPREATRSRQLLSGDSLEGLLGQRQQLSQVDKSSLKKRCRRARKSQTPLRTPG